MPPSYDPKTREPHWQKRWEDGGVYHFADDQPKSQTFVIDTPPPTVSGVLHMGHIFSYTQADFIARYKRMRGYDVFYPMGFDDNGLPTERLVEKVKKIRAHHYIAEHGREAFVDLCQDVVDEAETEFKRLFQSVALSVDWRQLYQTISKEVTALSQASFLDLIEKGEAYRDFRPTYWDWKDQTAIASAEIEEQELEGIQCHIPFGIMEAAAWETCANDPTAPRPAFDSLDQVVVMTTRPELLGACVALMIHPDDTTRYEGKVAVSPLFNVIVPIVADEKVDKEKGTGFVMCCSWGDDTDKEWIQQYNLAWRPLIGMDGKLSIHYNPTGGDSISSPTACRGGKGGAAPTSEKVGESPPSFPPASGGEDSSKSASGAEVISFRAGRNQSDINHANCFDVKAAAQYYQKLNGSKLIRDIKNENSAKGIALKLLEEKGLLQDIPPPVGGRLGGGPNLQHSAGTGPLPSPPPTGEGAIIKKTQTVKCAERSGAPIEIIPTYQWFIKITDKKEELKTKAAECDWNPEYMRVRLNQWADNLKEDWCISRQRFFGVPFPVWYVRAQDSGVGGQGIEKVYARSQDLPIDPFTSLPHGYQKISDNGGGSILAEKEGKRYVITPDQDVMDTWATSSISPQINAGGAGLGNYVPNPESRPPNPKLYPADIRPQAHEIIRTWAFYTIVKSYLHADTIPWKHLMISGWCLASDKTKMSKSKGNVVTPVELIEDKGADAVRYWASTSRLGADTAFSEDLLKIGKKLVTKLYNASNFAGQHLSKIDPPTFNAKQAAEKGLISETLDQWILTRLHGTIEKATLEFERFEYAAAREAIEAFFWKDFCDNYLELVKARVYGENDTPPASGATISSPTACGDSASSPTACGGGKGGAGATSKKAGFKSEKVGESPPSIPPASGWEGSNISASGREGNDATASGGEASAVYTLYYCLNALCKLFAPFVPHITEELYARLFASEYAQTKSVHTRGGWPDLDDYMNNSASEILGEAAVEILEAIRKAKSEASVSIKYPVSQLRIAPLNFEPGVQALASILGDLKAAGNVEQVELVESLDDGVATEAGHFKVAITLAKKEAVSTAG